MPTRLPGAPVEMIPARSRRQTGTDSLRVAPRPRTLTRGSHASDSSVPVLEPPAVPTSSAPDNAGGADGGGHLWNGVGVTVPQEATREMVEEAGRDTANPLNATLQTATLPFIQPHYGS